MSKRSVGRALAIIGVGILAPVLVGAVLVPRAAGEVYQPPAPASAVEHPPAPPRHDPAKPTAVVAFGRDGTNVADTLPPYEALVASDAFNVYTVAPERIPMPLIGGVDLLPDLSFAQLDALLPDGPDVIVVPQLKEPGAAEVVDWLRQQADAGDPLFVSVCVGAGHLAEAGLLDGRPATSHWLGMIGLRRDHPQVQWQDDVRYVDDGDVITTAGVLSGVDGALRVIERTAGSETATRAAEAVAWPAYSPGVPARITPVRLAPSDAIGLLSAAFRWDRPDLGVLLTDGIGETEFAAAFRPYTELSYVARTVPVTLDGRPIRTRHGLVLIPRSDLASAAGGLDRLIVPGAEAAEAGDLQLPDGLRTVFLHTRPEYAFDGALRDIEQTEGTAAAAWVAKTLQHPTYATSGSDSGWWRLAWRPLAVSGLAIALLLGVRALWGRRRSATR